jgi:hypothetical protein
MQKNTFIIVVLVLFSKIVVGQILPWSQYTDNSCWAASLAYVSSKTAIYKKSQCDIIRIREAMPILADCRDSTKVPTIIEKELVDLASEILNGYKCHTNNSMGINRVTTLLNTQKKPIIYNYLYDCMSSHIVVMDNVEKQIYNKDNHISLIRVKDPWPKSRGNEYYMTYERYYAQSIIPDNDLSSTNKYTIFWSDCRNNCTGFGITDKDKNYLQKVLYDSTAISLVNQFIAKQSSLITKGKSTLSDDFFRVTNIPKLRMRSLKTDAVFKVISSGKDKLFFEDTLISLTTIMNADFDEKIICVNEADTVKTVVSVSNKKVRTPTYTFYNNWIFYNIEKGAEFDAFFRIRNELDRNFNHEIINNEGLIVRTLNTSFMIFKIKSQYYVYDLYGDGFKKIGIQANKVIDFKTFNRAILEFRP